MMDWHLGTIGFTYPEWKGSFYPAGLPASQTLHYYSKAFNAVEINTTFYGPQSAGQIARWAAAVPADFRFCLKVPRQITHELRLQNTQAEMRAFIDSCLGLEQKLGALLIQLPPGFVFAEHEVLEKFLATLPSGLRFAVEFRHASWYTPATFEILRTYQVCWASTDYEDLPLDVIPTAEFLYLRWIAKHNVIPHPGYEVIDRTGRLQDWLARILDHQEAVSEVFGFFDNDYAGHAPATCNRLKTLAGLDLSSTAAAEQGRLF
jgi:uncharacterized protein YecE (DUF72 family)